MTLFRRAKPGPERRFAELGSMIPPPGSAWTAGVGGAVGTEQALRLSSVWAAHNLIADQVASLPVDEFRRLPDGSSTEVPKSRLITDPSAHVDALTWRYQAVSSFLFGGGIAGIVTIVGSSGWPEQIELVDPSSLDWRAPTKPGGEWEVRLLGKQIQRWPEGPLWYVPGRTLAGSPVGLSVIAYAAARIGLGLKAERYGADWFDGGGHPSGIIQSDQQISEPQARELKRRFMQATRNGEPAAMGSGISYQTVSVPANESQFLETIQASVADVARFFGMQPEMIGGSAGAGSSITYANIEQRFLHLRQVTLAPWVVRLENALTALTPRPRFVKLNRDAAVAMDLLTRVRAVDIQIKNRTMTRNEARELEDRAPVVGGDEFDAQQPAPAALPDDGAQPPDATPQGGTP